MEMQREKGNAKRKANGKKKKKKKRKEKKKYINKILKRGWC